MLIVGTLRRLGGFKKGPFLSWGGTVRRACRAVLPLVVSPLTRVPDLKSLGARQRGGAALDCLCVLRDRGGYKGLTGRVFAGSVSAVARVLPTCTLARLRVLR